MNATPRAPANALRTAAACLVLIAGAAQAQTPVDENGNPLGPVLGEVDDAADTGDVALLTATELETLVGPIALYPDDLLAIVLPASTYPLEIVQAARYLNDLEQDSSLKPDENWDDSVVALLNYPEVLRMMSDDIDWTWRLGEAVVAQQTDVVVAVESFRDRAYAAGNLKSDDRQIVTRSAENAIEIQPVEDDVIYVPYYEPEQVVVYQPRRVYHYYADPYPVYYYPYPAGHRFVSGYFWGVTTAFRIGWYDDLLHVHHHSFHGHPYFGWNYYGSYWRRPSITVFNNYYGSFGYRNHADRYRYGSYWRPRYHGGARPGHYTARSRYYTNRRHSRSSDGYAQRDQRRYRDRDQRDQRRDRDQRDRRRERRFSDDGRAGANGGQVVRQQRRDEGRRGGRANDAERARAATDEIRFRPRTDAVERRRAAIGRRGAAATVPRGDARRNGQPAARRDGSLRRPADADVRRSTTPRREARNEANRRQPAARQPGAAEQRRAAPPRASDSRRESRRATPPAASRSRPATPARRAEPPRARPAPTSRRPAASSAPRPASSRPAPRRPASNTAQRRASPAPRATGDRRSKSSGGPARKRQNH